MLLDVLLAMLELWNGKYRMKIEKGEMLSNVLLAMLSWLT